MNPRTYQRLQALLALGLGFYLFNLISSGKLYLYINVRFAWLTALGMLILLALGANMLDVLRRSRPQSADDDSGHLHSPAHDHAEHAKPSPWPLLLLLLPLLIGLLIPARPLGAEAASSRGVTVSGALISGDMSPMLLQTGPDQRTVLDWIRIFNTQTDLDQYEGETANVIGFVYRDPRLPADRFIASRFAVTCCVADAFALGMQVEWPDNTSLGVDEWVQVKGPIRIIEQDGRMIPLIVAESVRQVEVPAQPYLFP
jgi:putative membrane protein